MLRQIHLSNGANGRPHVKFQQVQQQDMEAQQYRAL